MSKLFHTQLKTTGEHNAQSETVGERSTTQPHGIGLPAEPSGWSGLNCFPTCKDRQVKKGWKHRYTKRPAPRLNEAFSSLDKTPDRRLVIRCNSRADTQATPTAYLALIREGLACLLKHLACKNNRGLVTNVDKLVCSDRLACSILRCNCGTP